MRILRRLIVVGFVLPLLALGSSLSASQSPNAVQSTSPAQQIMTDVGAGTAYQCCYVYWGGRWWCLPC